MDWSTYNPSFWTAAQATTRTQQTITQTVPFRIGGGSDSKQNTHGMQVAYFAWFELANAEALGDQNNLFSLLQTFWVHPKNAHNTDILQEPSNTGAGPFYGANIITEDPSYGARMHTWSDRQYGYEWREDYTHASKLGTPGRRSNNVSRLAYTDHYEQAAWVKSNMTVAYGHNDLDADIEDMHTARKLTATANNAYIEGNPTTSSSDYWYAVAVKRHSSMATDVAGRFQHWRNGVGENQGVDFVATDKWQWITMYVNPNFGSADRVRVRINTSGESLAVCRCCVYLNQAENFNFAYNSIIDDKNHFVAEARAPAAQQYIKAAQGEAYLEVVGIPQGDGDPAGLIGQWGDVGGVVVDNSHRYALSALGPGTEVRWFIWDDTGAQVSGTYFSATTALLADELLVLRFQWDANNPIPGTGGAHARISINGVWTNVHNAGWSTDANHMESFRCFSWLGGARYAPVNIALIRTWDAPQT